MEIRQIVLRVDSRGNYSSNDTVLASGELAVVTVGLGELDELGFSKTSPDVKIDRYLVIGDGNTRVVDLPKVTASFGIGPRRNGVDLSGKGRKSGITDITQIGASPEFETLQQALEEFWYPYSPPSGSLSLNVSNPLAIDATPAVVATFNVTAGKNAITQTKVEDLGANQTLVLKSSSPFNIVTPGVNLVFNSNNKALTNDYYRHSFRGTVTDGRETKTYTSNVDFVYPHYFFSIESANIGVFLNGTATVKGNTILANGAPYNRYKSGNFDMQILGGGALNGKYVGYAFPITGNYRNYINQISFDTDNHVAKYTPNQAGYNEFQDPANPIASIVYNFATYNNVVAFATIGGQNYGFILSGETATANVNSKIYFG